LCTGGDVIVGWVKDGAVTVRDAFAEKKEPPMQDPIQDVYDIFGCEVNGITELSFSRKLNTCDGRDIAIGSGATKLIFAYAEGDPSGNWLEWSNFHNGNKGAKQVFLLSAPVPGLPLPSDTKTVDLRVSASPTIPAYPGGGPAGSNGTTYWCKTFNLPADRKYHAIQVDPLLDDSDATKIVHHILLYDCPGHSGDVQYENYCFHNDTGIMPASIKECRGGTMIAGWGLGAGPQYYPSETGLPIGLGSARHVLMEVIHALSVYKYAPTGLTLYIIMLLQVHYDNDDKTKSFTDRSGLRLHYTQTLRQYDAAVLKVGYTVDGMGPIPAGQPATTFQALCPSECTSR
jgi:hypothetical protein